VRAFFIGTGLVVLLLGGWVVGVEAGGPPSPARVETRLITKFGQPKLQMVTVPQPVVSTVVNDRTKIVRIEGVGPTRVVVIHSGGKQLVAYLPVDQVPALSAAAAADMPLTVYVPQEPVTVTETVSETVTETATETQTDTVTETVTTPTSDSSSTETPTSP
jgi:hypothetical protein